LEDVFLLVSRLPGFAPRDFSRARQLAVFGVASGTYAVNGKLPTENHWQIPAAWRAVVRDGQIAEWRVYCDNQPARKLMDEKNP
jgi:hypothetical protein